MRYLAIAAVTAASFLTPAFGQLSINFGSPGVSIGINIGAYPTFQRVPGYPVYYAPGVNSNYFFYDGLYWVFNGDNWYASSWYNGPWYAVDPYDVPLYVLRVPVRYYRHAPAYFHGWQSDAPPRWNEHWGQSWESKRQGWNQWNRSSAPAPAPLPSYQKQYTGNRYPEVQQQAVIQTKSYTYQPKDPVAQQSFQHQRTQAQSAPQQQPQQQQQKHQQPQQQHQQTHAPQPPHEQQTRQPQPQPAEQRPQQEHASKGEQKGHGQEKGKDNKEEHGNKDDHGNKDH